MEPQVIRKTPGRRLTGCSAAALAIALAAAPAHGQSFNSPGTVISGLADIAVGAGITTITVDSPEVVINWSPDATIGSGPFLFQNQNTTATFLTPITSNLPNFTVLNRILPVNASGIPVARPVQFDGAVQSSSRGAPGGDIWFYSPTGIIAGPTATFNVGSLLLTTNDIDTSGGLFGPGNTVRFRGTAGSTGFVTVSPGAQLSTTPASGDYIAIVASRVTQSGTITSLGQTALVAAEQADITINAGLLDIVVTQGTTDANGIVHTGTTTGPASTDPTDLQIMQLVAMPKNTALTMLLSGNIGYAPAAIASADGSAIVLQAGVAPYVPAATQALGLGNISIGNSVFSNVLTADASNSIAIKPVSGLVNFQRDSFLTAGKSITATATTGDEIRGDGNLNLLATQAGIGGSALLEASGSGVNAGRIAVAGTLAVDASGLGFDVIGIPDAGADGIGNLASVIADGGKISAGTLSIDASGIGGGGLSTGGDGRGGTALLTIANGGSIDANLTLLSAGGFGGGGVGSGGDGTGGTATATFNGGPLTTTLLSVDTDAIGGRSEGVTGNAVSGKATIQVNSGTQTWDQITISSIATGGQTFDGGLAGSAAGLPDSARLLISGPGTSVTVAANSAIRADAFASVNAAPSSPATTANAGDAIVTVSGGGSLTVNALLTVSANAGVNAESYGANPYASPTLTGGTAQVTTDSGIGKFYSLVTRASATGAGATGIGGLATGGTATVQSLNSGQLIVEDNDSGGDLYVGADAFGGNGPVPSDAKGGTANLIAGGGSITVKGVTTVSSLATDGFFTSLTQGSGFAATGGNANLTTSTGLSGTSLIDVQNLVVRADGIANSGALPVNGKGGTGTGGNATLTAAAGTIKAAELTVQANGRGGLAAPIVSGAPYLSGSGSGGTALADIQGGQVTLTGALNVVSRGTGGGGGTASAGSQTSVSGAGSGGAATLNVAAGSVNAATMLIDATGFGGAGMANVSSGPGNGGDGASGTGGTAKITSPAGGTGNLATSGTVRVNAEGVGGSGGTATTSSGSDGFSGGGTGNIAAVDLRSGDFQLGPTSLSADGKPGGLVSLSSSNAGSAAFSLIDPALGAVRNRRLDSLTLSANTIASDSGTTSLTMQVGDAGSAMAILGNFTATATGASFPAPAGNGFTALISGAPLPIGADAFIATDRNIAMTVGTGGKFDGKAALTLSTPRTITTTGLIGSGGTTQVQGTQGISMTDLLAGGSTLLSAPGGPVSVSHDLKSTGPVTVTGLSIDLTSLGELGFADADATSGNLRIQSASNLDATTVDATGTVTLGSTDGAIHTTGAVNGSALVLTAGGAIQADAALNSLSTMSATAGGAFTSTSTVTAGSTLAIDAAAGITAPTVNSGGTTLLRATGGAINVATNLNSPGLVTVFGRSAALVSSGPLSFAGADATAGPLTVKAGGNLAFTTVNATGALSLSTTTGSLITNGAVTSGAASFDAPGFIRINSGLTATGGLSAITAGTFLSSGQVTTGGATSIIAPSGITIDRLSSGGTTLLRAINGTIAVSGSLRSVGLVTVLGRVVNLLSDGPLAFADADATAGNFSVQTAGDLDLATVDATGAVLLTSTGGAIRGTGAVNGNSITYSANGAVSTDAAITSGSTLQISAGGAFTAGAGVTAAGLTNIDAVGGISALGITSGGATLLRATGGPVTVGNVQSTGLVTVLGRSVDLGSTGALAFADADATAGNLRIQAAGNLDTTSVDASGTIALASTAGAVHATGALTGNGVTLTAANAVTADSAINSAGALTVTAGTSFTGPANIVAGGAVSIDATNGVAAQTIASGGTTLLRATGGAVTVSSNLTSPGAVTVLGRSANIVSTGGLTFADADATAGNLTILAGGPLVLATADATGALTLATSTGSLRTTGAVNGSSIALNAQGGIQLDASAVSGGTFQANTAGTFASTGAVTSAAAANVIASQGISMASLDSGGATQLRANTGSITVGNLMSAGSVTVLGRSVDLVSPGTLTFADADATAGNLRIQTAGNLDVATVDATGAVTLASTGGSVRNTGAVNGASIALGAFDGVTADANLTASGALQVNARGNFQINGRAVGTTIAATSGDIGIGSAGQLGSRGATQTIVLTNRSPTTRTLIGGANPSGGYSISAAEAARLFADQRITFTTPNDTSTPADFVIGDLALSYGGNSGNIGTGGALKVDAFGRVAVNGMVRLTTSSANDTFSIDPTRIEVIADQGGIIMRDAAGALRGRLELFADDVLVGTAANIAAVDAVDPLQQVTALLDAPSTVPSDGGYLQAGHIAVSVTSGFFGQNSGLNTSYPARRGFTANTMAITTSAPDTQIAINGQIIDSATGATFTGLQTAPHIDINGVPAAAGGNFDPQSTINGCIIGRNCNTSDTLVPKSTIDVLVGTPRPGSSAFRTFSIGADEKEEDKQLPLVDEPVTGVGNDDLWQRICDPDSGDCRQEGGNQ